MKIPRTLLAFLSLLLLLTINTLSAQKHTHFGMTLGDYELVGIEMTITPTHTNIQTPVPDKSFELYGVVICHTVDGTQKVARKDMTYKLTKEGKYTIVLSYKKGASVYVNHWETFYMPDDNYPAKESCF